MMTATPHEPSTPREFWLAIRPSPSAPANVFGPYTSAEAIAYRNEWLQTYPPSAGISAAFRATYREDAEQQAASFLPRV